MAEPDDSGDVYWYDPDPRAILPIDGIRIPRSVRKIVRDARFEVRFDTDFDGVISGCADREETWISRRLMDAYIELNRLGHAHSVECWEGGRLVGGLYGVAVAGLFCGESMFSAVSGASKVALVRLVDHLKSRRYRLLDIQMLTPHLERFGAFEISRKEYHIRLRTAISADVSWDGRTLLH